MHTRFKPPIPVERMLILERRLNLPWEQSGICNPGVERLKDGTLAVAYRAWGSDDIGHIGFCRLDQEGRAIVPGSRLDSPLENPTSEAVAEFPGGYGDPRLNKVGDWYYIWANGRNNEALAKNRASFGNDFAGQYMGGRQTVGFRTKDFKQLEYLGLCGPDEFDKNSFLHPEQVIINGEPRWVFFHRIQYNIQVIDVADILDLQKRSIWRSHIRNLDVHTLVRPIFPWEGVSLDLDWPGSVAGGPPPLRIPQAAVPDNVDRSHTYWLLFYNASGQPRQGKIAKDRRVGALIYRVKEDADSSTVPFEIVARSPLPILEPLEPYELNTPNGDVVFATGACMTVDDKAVDIFYGSGDVAISKARFDLGEMLRYLWQFDKVGHVHDKNAAG